MTEPDPDLEKPAEDDEFDLDATGTESKKDEPEDHVLRPTATAQPTATVQPTATAVQPTATATRPRPDY